MMPSTSPSCSRTRQSSWLATVTGTEPYDWDFRAASAVEPAAKQIRRSFSEGSYPVIGEPLGASTCCPASK